MLIAINHNGDGPLLPSLIALARRLGFSVSRDASTAAQVVFLGSVKEPELIEGARSPYFTA